MIENAKRTNLLCDILHTEFRQQRKLNDYSHVNDGSKRAWQRQIQDAIWKMPIMKKKNENINESEKTAQVRIISVNFIGTCAFNINSGYYTFFLKVKLLPLAIVDFFVCP